MQDKMKADYEAKRTPKQRRKPSKEDVVFKAPDGYGDHLDHFTNFFDSIRTGQKSSKTQNSDSAPPHRP